ncbi:4Fe-4S dicluster domain-containing protein [Desulfovibrio sp. JC010]|uniref:4Fe-4S dicluster domain-containing protein n=1 Tax=Desulfovibrio sp. JC010 TaxID=2593641 RepID=UPI001EF29E57|nr:4Fe-4S binding protein [Desulfovibrio sp. JC010]
MKRILNFKDDFAKKFHGKLIPTREAKKLLQALLDSSADKSVVLFESPCRASMERPASEAEICMSAGEEFASFAARNHPENSRRISMDEAIRTLETRNAKGHVHYICIMEEDEGVFYTICNCCPGCCCAIEAGQSKMPMLIPAGYIAVVDPHKCIGCAQCMEYCPFGAMNLRDKRMRINPKRCMGCGVCTNKCRKDALSLARNKKHPEPLLAEKLKG